MPRLAKGKVPGTTIAAREGGAVLLRLLARFILHRPGWVLVFGALITAPCIYWTTQLYSNLRLDLEELLPKSAQSVQDLDAVRARLLSIENLAVLVLSDHPDGSRRYVDDLAVALRRIPPSISAGVEYRINRETEFFEKRKALFMELNDLKKLRRYVADRVAYETELYNPLNIFSEIEIPEPKSPVKGFLVRYHEQDQAARFSRYPSGYYATPDQKKRALLVYLPSGANTIVGRRRLRAEVDRAIQSLNPREYAPDIQIHFTGEVQNKIDEYDAVLGDIERSAKWVTAIVALAILFYFKSILGTAALFLSLLMARFWAFAFTWFYIGYLNANSAFMGSIVLGSGITYGVMVLSRYFEERRGGSEPTRAADVSMRQTAHATWTAALAAGLAYGSLSLTEFEGFRQYGLIGLAAMVFCWLSAIGILPALLLVAERIHPLVKESRGENKHRIFRPVVAVLSRYPKATLAVSAALTAFAVYSLSGLNFDRVIEVDLSMLRSKSSIRSGAAFWSKDQDEIFQSYLSPVVIMPRSEAKAAEIANALKHENSAKSDRPLIVSVRTIDDFVPRRQQAKISELREMRRLLSPEMLAELKGQERKLAQEILRPESFRSFGEKDLPELVRSKFTEKSGAIGRLVLVEPPLDSSKWSFENLDRFVTTLRETAASVSGDRVPVAGSLPVTRDMFEAIAHDGPRATLAAFGAVILLVILLFRRSFSSVLVLFSLSLGVLWMAGFAFAWGVRINFLNFIALPITFGVGVDYGVNILERYRRDPKRDVIKAVRETGSAVTLCSFTTVVGYSSLIIANNGAFVSFGTLAAAGEVGTMLAAIMTLPAVLMLLERRRKRVAVPTRISAPSQPSPAVP